MAPWTTDTSVVYCNVIATYNLKTIKEISILVGDALHIIFLINIFYMRLVYVGLNGFVYIC